MWLREHALILVLFALYTAALVRHALIGQRRTRDLADFLVGGRSLGGAILGVSFFATYASTNSFIGFAGRAYAFGVAWLLIVPTAVVLSFVAWAWLAPRLRGVTEILGSVTIPDYIGLRFNSQAARFTAALIVIFSSFLYMTAVFKGIGSLVVELLDLTYGIALFVVVLVVVLYTMIGGFHSVARTDLLQGMQMTLAAILMFFAITHAAGGIGRLADLARIDDGALVRWDTAEPLGVLIGVVFASTVKLIVEPRQLSRFYALETEAAARSGLVVSTLSFLVVFSLLTPLGLYAHFVVGQGVADTDRVIPMMLSDPAVFPPVIQAFLFLALVSAAMSSLDSVLLVMASTFQRDLLGLLVQADDRHAVRNTRVCVVLFAAITAILAIDPPGGIVELTSFSGALYAACFLPSLALGLTARGKSGFGPECHCCFEAESGQRYATQSWKPRRCARQEAQIDCISPSNRAVNAASKPVWAPRVAVTRPCSDRGVPTPARLLIRRPRLKPQE